MIDTVEEALNPFCLVTFIFGCGILRYPLGQSRYRLSIFYILIVWSAYACAIYYYKIFQSFRSDTINSLLTSFMIILNLFVTMISIIITVSEHEKFYTCIMKLDLVNDTLEKLGIPKEYYRLRNWIKWSLTVLFFMISTSWTFDSLVFVERYNDIRAIIVPIIMDYTLQINTIMDVMFILLLSYVGSRFDKINDCIILLSQTENFGLRFEWKKSLISSYYIQSAESRKRILWTIIHLHLDLCRIARDINGFFGVQMTLQMLSYFAILIGMFHFQYSIILYLKEIHKCDTILVKIILSANMWVFIFLMKFFSVNYVCESVSKKARRTKDIIHRLTNIIYFSKVHEEISQFVLQISLRPLKFNGLDMFYFGYDFIRKFFVWILTAILLIVQTDITPMFRMFMKYNGTYYN